MPYILKSRRKNLIRISGAANLSEGDLNYCITAILLSAWRSDPCYATANKIIGVLECAKQEFYRRHVAPYEDKKMKENGDV